MTLVLATQAAPVPFQVLRTGALQLRHRVHGHSPAAPVARQVADGHCAFTYLRPPPPDEGCVPCRGAAGRGPGVEMQPSWRLQRREEETTERWEHAHLGRIHPENQIITHPNEILK